MEFKVKTKSLKSASGEIKGSAKALKNAESDINNVIRKIDLGTSTDAIRYKLKSINKDLQFLDAATTSFRRALEDISLQYMLTEIAVKNQSVKVLDPETVKKIKDAIERTNKTLIDTLRKGDHRSNAKGGDPVNLDTGNFIYDKEDLVIEGVEKFSFARFYNSVDRRIGPLGKGWTHNYDIRLETGLDTVTVVLNDGREEIFSRGTGDCIPLSGSTADLSYKNERYEYKRLDGGTYYFDVTGRLIRIEDANGVGCSLEYSDMCLTRIIRDSGEYYQLSYADETDNRLTTVKDHTGRSAEYIYEDGLLTAVRIGDRENRYGYDVAGNLSDIINPHGIRIIRNEYDSKRRVVSQQFPDETSISYEYDETTGATVMVEKNGSSSYHFHDELFRNTENVYPDGKETNLFDERNQIVFSSDKNGNETHYSYDNKGNVSKIVMADETVIAMTYERHNKPVTISVNGVRKQKNVYDDKGNLLETTDGIGRTTSFKYNGNGFVTEIRRPSGKMIELLYDEKNNIVAVTGENGARTEYEYDDLNRVIRVTDGRGNSSCYEYDEYNNLIKVVNAEGYSCSYTYNGIDKVTGFTDYNGASSRISYNNLGRPESITDPLGRVTGIFYDSMWNESEYRMPNGGIRHLGYDENNNLAKTTDALGNSYSYEYDGNGNIIYAIDPEGAVTTYSYDQRNNLTGVINPEGNKTTYQYENNRLIRISRANGATTDYEYDEADQLIREINALGYTKEYTYTCDGDIESIIDEAGRITFYEYAYKGKPSRIIYPDGREELFAYDENGNVRTRSNKQGYTVTYVYDELDRVTEIRDSEGAVTSYTHDATGNITSVTDPKGNTTEYSYTLTGKLNSVTDALGNKTEYEYDQMDMLIRIDQHGEGETHTTRYIRDLEGNIIESVDALGLSDKYSYNGRGDILTKLDKDGYLTQYGYNNNGDLDSIIYGDGKEVMMSYDTLRKLSEIRDWTGKTSVESDILGRAVKVTYPDNRFAAYTYGHGGERTSITYPDGRVVQYSYDDVLRLTSLREGNTNIEYSFDEFGQLAGKVFANGLVVSYTYNERGMLTELRNSVNNEILDSYEFTYDLLGNKTSISKHRKGISDESDLFEYGYDALGRLETVSKGGVLKKSYSYDAFGNRVALNEEGARFDYRYNAINQLMESVSSDGTREHFKYDRRGNLVCRSTNDKAIHSYLYGALNRLEASHSNKGYSRYEYNGLGHRIEEQTTSAAEPERRIHYTLDFTKEYHNLLERETNGNAEVYLWDGIAVAMKGSNGNRDYYFADDDLGSPIRLIDSAGSISASCSYDEFGLPIYDDKMHVIQPFGFTGYRVDSVADTYFAEAREYQPEYGRFTSQDTIKGNIYQTYTLNNFTYCWNNPLRYVDLDGMAPRDWPRDEVVISRENSEYINELLDKEKWKEAWNGPTLEEHYSRNQYNTDIPEYLTPSVKQKMLQEGWVDNVPKDCHTFYLPEGEDVIKMCSPDGREAIYYESTGKRVHTPENEGTFNYYPSESVENDPVWLRRMIGHFKHDIEPWIKYGNSRQDPTEKTERLLALIGVKLYYYENKHLERNSTCVW